jgi:glycosyltransferase involved in cell wall biosynthesis
MGIDTDLFMWASGDTSSDDRGPLIVAVGSLTANKNHQRLIEAINGLEHVRLVIIGEGPERDALQSLIEANDLGKRVALAGRVPLYELPAWFLRANACTLVSVREGFGLSALEGSACGARPVVSTTAPLARVVAHAGGVIVDPTSVDAIAAGLTQALALGRLSQSESEAIIHGQDVYTRAQVVLDTLNAVAHHN